MNLSEERNYQKLLDTLDAMKLTASNRKLAEEYLDTAKEENRECLSQAEHQDFSGLPAENRNVCTVYVEHCQKRKRTEELGRFVRLAAAVGGSTAVYVLVNYGYNLNSLAGFLSQEQIAAIRAEDVSWNVYKLKNAAAYVETKNPKVLFGAMKLCYHKNANAKVLLAGLVLRYSQPVKEEKSGFLVSWFSKPVNDSPVKETVKYLDDMLTASIPNLFTGAAPADAELKLLQSYVQTATEKTPFPQEVFSILQGKLVSEYLIQLLAGAAFLSIEHSGRAVPFLRLAAALSPAVTLDICWKIGESVWFLDHIEKLEEELPMPRETFILWCLGKKATAPIGRAMKKHPDEILQIASRVNTMQYQELLAQAKRMNPALYEKMENSCAGEFGEKLAEELTGDYKTGKQEARRYLLGEEELDALYPFVKEWRSGWEYNTERLQKIFHLKNDPQKQQMYRRAVVLEGLRLRVTYFTSFWNGKYQKIDKEIIGQILDTFGQENLPVSYQLEVLCALHDHIYMEKEKTAFINNCIMILSRKKTEWENEFTGLAREGTAMVRFLCIRVLDTFGEEYKETLLSCAADSSKQVRELLVAVYEDHKNWEPEIKAMLGSKKSQEREMAVLVLKRWGADSCRAELEAALAAEKSKKIKELMEDVLGIEGQPREQTKKQSAEQLVKDILKGGKKRKISWVLETPLPEVHMLNGTPASEDYLAAILVSYADMGVPGVNKESKELAGQLNPGELASYMGLLFNKWLDTGAEAKKKWVLYAASIHGGETIIPALHAQIQEWPKASRGAMAAEAVKALALNGSPTALLLVDQISRKFKFRQVKAAAGEALSYAAEQLGITRAELEDRIVPNLGFDERMERTFDYGTRSFRVLLSPSLDLEVYDETGKKLKSLPAPGKKDEPEKAKAASEEFKLLKKQLKTVAGNQKLRLEQALSAERLWPVEQWKELFVKNPVMHQFAIGLIWGLYEEGALKDTFRYMEDGSFNTVDEDEYEFPSEGLVGLVHPIELSEEELSAWKEQLSDYEVVQPMEQLERPIYRITEEEKKQRELTRFGGKLLNGLSLSGKLQGMGWYRGSVQDAGIYSTFYREDGSMGVELEFSGCYVGDENEEITVYGARFYKAGTVARGSYVYDTIKEQNEYKLGEISPRYFSEIILQLTKATASSQEQLAYPECKER